MNDAESPLDLQLRRDIEMYPARPDADGSAGWILHDPLQHRYFRIDEPTYDLFCLWMDHGTFVAALQAYHALTGLEPDEAQLHGLIEFATNGNLLLKEQAGEWRTQSQRAENLQKSWITQILHQYLFFKVPLFHPQALLEATWPHVRPLFSRTAVITIAILALIGLYLVSRQWDVFWSNITASFTPQGALGFTVSLILLKAAHEMGHAYMAVRFGCRVPVIGVAFMMLTPLLYSDVSDAWKLPSRRSKMLISGAGILVELSLAVFATLIWVFMPDGIGRSIAFMIATTAWVMSLAINLNPFMRFDGYYLLSDWLGVDNLQPRAFALGRWKMRQWLIAPTLAPPEKMAPLLQTGLIFYAWATWIYRLILYTTIALIVYQFTFKLLGILLFGLEIGLLLIAPIIREIKEWRTLDLNQIPKRRITIAASALAALFLLVAVPWSGRVSVPAVLVASDLSKFYTARAGQITQINAGHMDHIDKGATVFTLRSPKLENEIMEAVIKRDLTIARLKSAMSDAKTMQQSLVLKEELSSQKAKLLGLMALQNSLMMRAPIDGNMVQIAPNIHVGQWVKRGQLLALMSSGAQHIVRGYVSEHDLKRITPKIQGRFVPDDIQLSSFDVQMHQLAPANSETINITELASPHGGPVAALANSSKELIPQLAQYRIDLTPGSLPFAPRQIIRGMVYLDGTPESYLTAALRHISKVLIRETGF